MVIITHLPTYLDLIFTGMKLLTVDFFKWLSTMCRYIPVGRLDSVGESPTQICLRSLDLKKPKKKVLLSQILVSYRIFWITVSMVPESSQMSLRLLALSLMSYY